MRYLFLFISLLLILAPTKASFANADESSTSPLINIKIANEYNQVQAVFSPFERNYDGEIRMVATDLGTDGIAEILVANGKDLPPEVHVLRQDGSEIGSFLAYDEAFRGGITIASCDIDGNGTNDIITGTQYGGGPHIRAFDGYGTPLPINFFAYDEDFRGGIEIACGDVNNDGMNEIITVPASGGGPHVKVFSSKGRLLNEFFAGDASDLSGRTLTVANIDNNDTEEIIIGTSGIGTPYIWVLNAQNGLHISNIFKAPVGKMGMHLSNISYRNKKYLALTSSWERNPNVYIVDAEGNLINTLNPFMDDVESGLLITPLQDSEKNTFIAATLPRKKGAVSGKYILVDISEQRMYAYENGILQNTFLVSTGRTGKDTPQGITEVTDKILWHDYQWNYGPNDPRNYYVPDVKYNLRFRQYYYIHYAYWHNDFGFQRSSGCVNVDFESADWIYNWSEIGTPVEITD